ncbi:MAG: AraC family transcriptional regulator [Flavobacteriales bacterium]|nr:AraC family transcriptional regulator [Flavobacteriales bacterium]
MKICYGFAMNTTLLAQWQSNSETNTTAIVIPDGCRDLIMRMSPGKTPYWFVSSLGSCTYTVSIKAGVFMQGFRLKPGVRIDEERLLASIQNQNIEFEDVYCRLASSVHLSPSVSEALDCLASDVGSVARAARELGVGQRSLQRLLTRETGQPPVYWMLLARVRKSARAVLGPRPLAEIAVNHRYADQAHMSREFKRWLNISPLKTKFEIEVLKQLSQPGYS